MLLLMYSSLLVAEVNLQFDLSLIGFMNVLFTSWTLEQGSWLLETVWIACCIQYHVICLLKAGDIYLLLVNNWLTIYMYNSITNVHTVCELRCDSSASTCKYLKYIYVYVTLNSILIIWNCAKELNFMAWHAEKSFFKPKITPSSTWESSRFEMNNYAVRWNLVYFETQFWEMLQCVHWPRHVWMIFPI